MKNTIIRLRSGFSATVVSFLFLAPVTAVQAQAPGSITTSMLANSSVTARKIKNGSVSNAKLANGSVTIAKIAANIGVWLKNGSNVYSNNNVGIGTSTPSSKLDVIGTLSASGLRAPGAGINTVTFAFTHKVTSGSLFGNYTLIDNPLCNADPNAIVIVTHNWSADTSSSTYLTNAVGVWYNGTKWSIFDQTNASLEVGDTFNVMVIKP